MFAQLKKQVTKEKSGPRQGFKIWTFPSEILKHLFVKHELVANLLFSFKTKWLST